MLNDDEIVISEQEESDPVDDETDEDEDNNNNESSKGPSNADAFSALETDMECVRFHIMPESHSVFGYPNNRVSEPCPVPVGSDKRRYTVYQFAVIVFCSSNLMALTNPILLKKTAYIAFFIARCLFTIIGGE
ncbi:hypothetical protein TNCV_592091 [Trichonephila clavipes]|nr:hypothetical protein TNCV_592091 [Trichonephila clavipes]